MPPPRAALLGALLAACAPAPASPAAPGAAGEAENPPPPEATAENAGAPRCTLRGPFSIADLGSHRAFVEHGHAAGFGARGGLAAWGIGPGTRARPLGRDGQPRGAEIPLPLPDEAEPRQVVPIPGGFAVVALRSRWRKALCDSHHCGLGAGTCIKPCEKREAYDVVVQRTDLAGRASGVPAELRTGPDAVAHVIPGRGGVFGLLSYHDFITVRAQPGLPLALSAVALPEAPYPLPVLGEGPPSVLLLDTDGTVRLVTAEGIAPVAGPTRDALAGEVLGPRSLARWGPDGRIHVAHPAWPIHVDSISYAVLDGGALHAEGSAPRGGVRGPFAVYVEGKLSSGRLTRSSWLHDREGEDADAAALDPAVAVADVVWTGAAFVLVYAAEPQALRGITADCAPDE